MNKLSVCIFVNGGSRDERLEAIARLTLAIKQEYAVITEPSVASHDDLLSSHWMASIEKPSISKIEKDQP